MAAVAALLVVLVVALTGIDPALAQDDTPPAPPPVTVSDFYPEDANLSDCVGLVERPGCGSEARGGWRQFTIFALLVAGFAVIAWRISVSVRANRTRASDSSSSEPSTPPPTGRKPA